MATTVSSSNVSQPHSIAATSGKAAPLGATVFREGVNFSLFSRDASAVELLLFNREDDAATFRCDQYRSICQPHLSLLARICAGNSVPDNSTDIESTDHLILTAVCVSMPISFFSILMGAAWLSPTTTTEKLHAFQGAQLQPR